MQFSIHDSSLIFQFNALYLTLIFCVYYSLKNAGIVDVFWPTIFIADASIIIAQSSKLTSKSIFFFGLLTVSCARLLIYLASRFSKNYPTEDIRYSHFKASYHKAPNLAIFLVYQLQGIFASILFIPLIPGLTSSNNSMGAFEYIGISIFILSLTGEWLADKQLTKFKQNPLHKNKICQIGLWKYSRHPNYFFEWLTWVSYSIYLTGDHNGHFAILSSLLMLFLLIKVTGVKPTEELMLQSRGDSYKEYMKNTSVFFPWPQKNKDSSKSN